MLLKRAAWALLTAAAAGCAAGTSPRAAGARREPEARRAIAELAATYQRGQAEEFFALVDQSDFPDFSSFQYRIRKFLLHNHGLNLDVIFDSVVENGDEVAVTARWNKAFVDEDGHQRKENGSCELLLKARPSGGLALLFVRGDSPF